MLSRLLSLLTVALVVAPLLGRWFGGSFFLCELLSHFPVQYAGLAGLLLLFWLGSKRWSLAFVSLVGLGLNLALCIDWFLPSLPPLAKAYDLRVYHANVLYTRSDYRPVIDTIRKLRPDFFVLHEMPAEGVRAVAELRRDYPYQDSVWAKGPCFILVGSRTPFRADSAARRSHRVISLTSTVRSQPVSLITVHPRTPLLPSWYNERNWQLAFVADQLAHAKNPAILLGDFNISPFSPVYKRNFLERQDGGKPLEVCRRPFGLTPTWPRFLPPMFIPIDHAFVNAGFQTVNFRTLVTPDSDHRAICVDLVYRQNRSRL